MTQVGSLAQQALATTQLQLGKLADARRNLADATAILEQLRDSNKKTNQPVPPLATALLMQADLERAAGDGEAARAACIKAQQVLGNLAEHSFDYALLAPHVRAHMCTGNGAAVADQKARLQRIAYQETHYMRALAAPAGKASP
eukprot:gene37779-46615_t